MLAAHTGLDVNWSETLKMSCVMQLNCFLCYTGTVQNCSHDDPRLRPDLRDLPLLHGLCRRPQPVHQDRSYIQTVLRAVVLPASLRLRHEGGEVGADRRGESQDQVSGAERRCAGVEIYK